MDARMHGERSQVGPAPARAGLLVLVLAAALGGGCLKDPTEVVIVVDSDLTPFVDFDVIEFIGFPHFSGGFGGNPNGNVWATSTHLPATLGVVPQQFAANEFDVMVTASRGFDVNGLRTHVVSHRASNIHFVADEQRAVFIPLMRECACNGTNCPNTGPCKDIKDAVLLPFDEDHIPHL